MRHVVHVFVITFVLMACNGKGLASALEDEYLAARERYIKAINETPPETQESADDAALSDLEARLRRIIGPINYGGHREAGKINVGTFILGNSNYAMLDGLKIETDKEKLVVTTKRLLLEYARTDLKLPSPDVRKILRRERTYAQSLEDDAGPRSMLLLPIADEFKSLPFALAVLVQYTNGDGASPPNSLIVSTATDSLIRVAMTSPAVQLPSFPACEKRYNDWQERQDDSAHTNSAHRKRLRLAKKEKGEEEPGPVDFMIRDFTGEDPAFDDFIRCYAKRFKSTSEYTKIKNQSEALMKRITFD